MAKDKATKATDEAAAPKVGNRVPAKYRTAYKAHHNSCGDRMADAMRAYCEAATSKQDAVNQVGADNEVDVAGRWGARNIGMQRMNLGNVLRGKLKRGTDVRIGDVATKGEVVKATKPTK